MQQEGLSLIELSCHRHLASACGILQFNSRRKKDVPARKQLLAAAEALIESPVKVLPLLRSRRYQAVALQGLGCTGGRRYEDKPVWPPWTGRRRSGQP